MDEHLEKLKDHNRVDAGRGVPQDRGSKDAQKLKGNASSDDDNERLDERIRKAGI